MEILFVVGLLWGLKALLNALRSDGWFDTPADTKRENWSWHSYRR